VLKVFLRIGWRYTIVHLLTYLLTYLVTYLLLTVTLLEKKVKESSITYASKSVADDRPNSSHSASHL